MKKFISSLLRSLCSHLTNNGNDKSAHGIALVLLGDLGFLLKSVWLYFPPIIFLLISYVAFWKLAQGQDILLSVFEKRLTFVQFIITHTLWVFMTWFTSRLLSYGKKMNAPNYLPDSFFQHIPRIIGFTCYTLIILAFIRISSASITPPPFAYTVAILMSFPYYALLNYLALKIKAPTIVQLTLSLAAIFILLVSFGLWSFNFRNIIVVLILLQTYYVFFVVGRRKLIEKRSLEPAAQRKGMIMKFMEKMAGFFFIPNSEGIVFIVFNIVSVVFLSFYIACFMNLEVALLIRSCSFIFLAFAFLVGFSNIISFFSVKYRISFHVILLALAFFTGRIEPYRVLLIDKKDPSIQFEQRQNIREYFRNWVNQRKDILNDTSVKNYPVFFVMANGGASRSGYWVASVLSTLEDSSKGIFSNHLFCLSGASGGSLGNATFFTLLRYKNELARSRVSSLEASKEYLRSDFLTFTLANMLGPDYFRHLYPVAFLKSNRANALIKSIEAAPADSVFLKTKLADGFSQFIAKHNDKNYNLPVLFINATRMQDGRPSVISNIKITDSIFNNRIDLLSLLDSSEDMKLSTAVEIGASFPYISPGNRIDQRNLQGVSEANYFVDGGYFDNSGAGVVHEMIMQIQELLKDSTDALIYPFRKKIQCYVVHILNDAITNTDFNSVSPIQNDLAAPLITLAGSYGVQTSTNDLRLKKYLKLTYDNSPTHYIPVNLYRPNDKLIFPMNWVISQKILDSMDKRLEENERIKELLHFINSNTR